MKPIDVTGQRYGRLIGVRRTSNEGRRTKWFFQCDCGTLVAARLDHVRDGRILSCDCLRTENLIARSETHGHTKGYQRTAEYRAWCHAKGRCFNPDDPKYPQYGGRGITMCKKWANDFSAFARDMGQRPSAKHSLDRQDVNKGYEPGNCRWATTKEQARTRTDNVMVKFRGKNLCLKDFAEVRGIPYKRLHHLVNKGIAPLKAARRLIPCP